MMPLLELDSTKNFFVKNPFISLLLSIIFTQPSSPLLIGVCGQMGMVHPQLAVTLYMTKGLSPLLEKGKLTMTFSSVLYIFPRFIVFSLNIKSFFLVQGCLLCIIKIRVYLMLVSYIFMFRNIIIHFYFDIFN